jgi:hypothetical protein
MCVPVPWRGTTGSARAVVVDGRRDTVIVRRRRWGGIRQTGAHAQRRCAKSAGDGCPRNQSIEFHAPSPVCSVNPRTFVPDNSRLNRLAMYLLW